MKTEIAICTIAFGDHRYLAERDRLCKSMAETNPDIEILSWVDQYPPSSPSFDQSMFGFKVYAVQEALNRGYKKIIWLDPACIVKGDLSYYFMLDLPTVIAVKDDNVLSKTISDKALKYYGNPDVTGWHLVGGSLYVFNFNHPQCMEIFKHWQRAEKDGVFGTTRQAASEQINKHRNDESCMAVALYAHGVEPVSHDVARYCNGENSIILKQHWK